MIAVTDHMIIAVEREVMTDLGDLIWMTDQMNFKLDSVTDTVCNAALLQDGKNEALMG